MAASDYTLLSRLGFQDPDKKNRRHDYATRYIAARIGLVVPEIVGRPVTVDFEAVVSKGRDQYKQHIGFIDAVVWYWSADQRPELREPEGRVLVETKISPTTVAEILRQIGLYCEHAEFNFRVLAVDFDLSVSDVEILSRHGIRSVRLGSAFDAWLRDETSKPKAALQEI